MLLRAVALGSILVITAVTYRGVTANGYVLDDVHAVAANPSITSLALAPRWLFTADAASALRELPGYRPVLLASYALDYAIWPNPAVGLHRTNLLIHLVTVLLVFVLARRLWNNDFATVAATVMTALHPINAEAVNYLSARSSSLATLLVLVSVWAYDAAVRDTHRPRATLAWFGAALLAGTAALGTKEAAAVLPLLVLVWDRARFGDHTPWRTSLIRSLPFWAATALFLLMRSIVMGNAPVAASGFSPQAGLFAVKILLSSFGHWFWPTGLAADHGWKWTIETGEAAWLLVGLGAAVVATAALLRHARGVGWCLVWSWVALLPLAALPTVSRVTLYQDHRVYLAGVGLAWAVGGGVAIGLRVWSGALPRAVVAVAGAVMVIAMIRADLARSAVWVNEATLWEDVLTKYPNSVVALNARGLQSLNAGRLDDAERDFQAILRLVPNSPDAHKNLGVVYAEAGDTDRAIEELQAALAITPRSPGVLLELGLVYEHTKAWDAATRVYEQVLTISPSQVPALKGLARAAEREQRYDVAAGRYRDALAVNPGDDDAWSALGAVLLRLQQWGEAKEAYEAVLSRHPGDAQTRFNLGVALDGLGNAPAAMQAYTQAAASLPQDPDIAFRIGLMHERNGRVREAAASYEQALARDPRHVPSHFNLARIAEQAGDPQRALAHYRAVVANTPSKFVGSAFHEQALAAIKRLESAKRG